MSIPITMPSPIERDREQEIVADAGAGERGVVVAAEPGRIDRAHQLEADLLRRERNRESDLRGPLGAVGGAPGDGHLNGRGVIGAFANVRFFAISFASSRRRAASGPTTRT